MQHTSRPGHVDGRRVQVYAPAIRPGFTAWVTAFDYGDGSIGVSFKETTRAANPHYEKPTLEMGEAAGSPVSYGAIDFASPDLVHERVYLRTQDGETYEETGRSPLDLGAFTNLGFPDGRIVGLEVRRTNATRTGWADEIDVRESSDGGSTWTRRPPLLRGTSPYLWRTRRLSDGMHIVLASFYGTPWGADQERPTRNTMFPGETYLGKIQTFFLTTRDGREFSEPHYVLPGVGAHEYDVAERDDGSLLFVAGDVQATPVARQIVRRTPDGYINGSLLSIERGAPPHPASDPQGGFVPETIVRARSGILVGARRNKPYSVSNDDGMNWTPVEDLPPSLYQPFMIALPNGRIANFGHVGGDSPFGHEDMTIGVDLFDVQDVLPPVSTLTLRRVMSEDRDQYLNAFEARLARGSVPVSDAEIVFRFVEVWNDDGSYTTTPQKDAPLQLTARTDADGIARIAVSAFDGRGDINLYYSVDAVHVPEIGPPVLGPTMVTIALTPRRGDDQPHAAYLMEGTLYVAERLERAHPGLIELLRARAGGTDDLVPVEELPPGALEDLAAAGVVEQSTGVWRWLASVHAPQPLAGVTQMPHDDQYA